jgi:hypothetical protein
VHVNIILRRMVRVMVWCWGFCTMLEVRTV